MRSKSSFLRGLICALVAAAFAVAAEPGAMAMPTPQPMTMDCAHHGVPGCDHMKPQKEQGAPCKGMTMCLGMLSCFGMAAVATTNVVPANVTAQSHAPRLDESAHGLTYPPDNPPPIA
jgi:hypothetical protein